MRWITVEERFPESDTEVLVTQLVNNTSHETRLYLASYYSRFHRFYCKDTPVDNIVAWQPVYPYRTLFKKPENDSFTHAAEMFIECQLNQSCDDCLYKEECSYNTEHEIESPNKRMAFLLSELLEKCDKLSTVTAEEFEDLLS